MSGSINRLRNTQSRRPQKRALRFELLEERRLLSANVHQNPGVEVTDTAIITPHDTIPRFGALPTVVAIESGDWSNPLVWSDGSVPSVDAIVSIPAGLFVTYDVDSSVELDVVEVSGSLDFDPSVNTSLWLNELMVMPSGKLTVGTAENPIDASVSAEIVFTDTPGANGLNFKTGTVETPGIDPSQYGNGLLSFGSTIVRGRALDQTFFRIGSKHRGW